MTEPIEDYDRQMRRVYQHRGAFLCAKSAVSVAVETASACFDFARYNPVERRWLVRNSFEDEDGRWFVSWRSGACVSVTEDIEEIDAWLLRGAMHVAAAGCYAIACASAGRLLRVAHEPTAQCSP